MVEHVGRLGGEGQVVPARSGLIQTPRSAAASAQAAGADTATSAATAASSTTATSAAAPCGATAFNLGANANHFAYAHVQADIRRTGAETVGDDLFVGAEGVRIQAAILGDHDVYFTAARGESGAGVLLVVPGQIAASGHVKRRARVVGEKRIYRDTVGRGEISQDHEAVVNIETASSIIKPWILSNRWSVGDPTGIGLGAAVGIEGEKAESRVTRPA